MNQDFNFELMKCLWDACQVYSWSIMEINDIHRRTQIIGDGKTCRGVTLKQAPHDGLSTGNIR